MSLYKTVLLLQKKVNGGKERAYDTFIAGLLGGYIVFGERNAINEQVRLSIIYTLRLAHTSAPMTIQIVLYVCSRVVASFIPRATQPYSTSSPNTGVKPVPPDSRYFTAFAALSWGLVMWLFEHRGETIQPGMFNSMVYLYRDSNRWSNLKTLLWHNT